MSPTGSESGRKNADLLTQISVWNRRTKLGIVFDSSTGFTLPNGAKRSPRWLRHLTLLCKALDAFASAKLD